MVTDWLWPISHISRCRCFTAKPRHNHDVNRPVVTDLLSLQQWYLQSALQKKLQLLNCLKHINLREGKLVLLFTSGTLTRVAESGNIRTTGRHMDWQTDGDNAVGHKLRRVNKS